MKRKEIVERKKAIGEIIKAACAPEKDHLSSFSQFRCYEYNGHSFYLKSGRGDKLSSKLKHYIQDILKINMERVFGSEWQAEEKIKRKEMVSPEARYIFVYETADSDANQMSESVGGRGSQTICANDKETIVGFVHFRFTLEEEVPVLYVYELQLEPRAQGKGLGNFLMQLIELIACENRMSAVVLTVQKENLLAMNFYTSKLRYTISSISPSRVNQLIGLEKSYEILCKVFGDEAKAVLKLQIYKLRQCCKGIWNFTSKIIVSEIDSPHQIHTLESITRNLPRKVVICQVECSKSSYFVYVTRKWSLKVVVHETYCMQSWQL